MIIMTRETQYTNHLGQLVAIHRKFQEGDRYLVDCEIWLENGKGEKTTSGGATVMLLSKTAPPL